MRILFMGTPDIAAECLKALYAAGHEICGVYTRRDKPVGRKQVLTAPPVKEVALEHGTPVFQPRTLRDGSEDANIQALAPELIVVVAYGCILPRSVLEAPKYGCINLHVSLLPKYRGSAPVQWAVLNGDAETGVSIMQMDEGLDTGDVLVCEKVAIDPEETSGRVPPDRQRRPHPQLGAGHESVADGMVHDRRQEGQGDGVPRRGFQRGSPRHCAGHQAPDRGVCGWGHPAAACGAGRQKTHGRHLVRSGSAAQSGGYPVSGPNPRAAAVSALVRQEQDGFSNLVLDAELKRQKLEGRDKAFASAIFYTVLEHRGTLDYILAQFLPKGLAKLDAPVREILRSALAQARYMQVPVSAAVNEAVKLTRAFKKSSASGLVNAVLRRACVYDLSKARFQNETERLMVLGSAGQDVAEFLRSRYPDEALGILTYAADGGRTSLRANPLKADVPTLCEKLNALGAAAQPGVVPGSVLAKFEGSPADNDLFRAGKVRPASWPPSAWRQSPAKRCWTSARLPAARPSCWPRRCRVPVGSSAATRRKTASG